MTVTTATPESSTRWALAALSLSILMPSLDTSIANAGLATLAQAFNASFQAVQWIVLAYLLAVTALIVSAGRLGDIFGRKRLLLGGIALFTLASLLCGSAPGLGWLLAARAAQGVGAAVMMALTMAMVGETVPKARTGSAMGLLGTMSAVGTAIGPSLGGLLIAGMGWRMIFLVNVPIGLLNLYLVWRYLPSDRTIMAKAGFDAPGTLVLALTLGAYALAMTLGRGHFGALNGGLLAAAIAGAAIFLVVEAKAAFPLVPLEIFRQRGLGAGLAMSTLVSTVVMATLVVGPFYLSRGLGLPPAMTGLALSVGPLVAALGGVPAGRLADRFGARTMVLTGLGGIVTGCFILSLIPAKLGVTGYVLPIAVITGSYALFQAANNIAIMMGVSPEKRGVISGMLSLSRNLGLITGASFMGAVFSLASAADDVAAAEPEAVANGMHVTFAVAGLLAVAALVISGSQWLRRLRPA